MSGSVSAILCAFSSERWDDLRRAVSSVQEQTVPAEEIVVVIDHNPELLERARAELAGARVIANDGGRGAGEARNCGVAVSRGTILGFLDDDARAEPDWIAQALAALEEPAAMGVGGTIEPAWDVGPPGWFPPEFNWIVGCTYPGLPRERAPVRNLIAANMFVRREVFEELGGFRVGFGKQDTRSRPEETDLCLRANARWPERVWLYEPRVAVHHRVPVTRGRPSYFISRCYNEGLGKAALVGYVGADSGLAAEREYTRRTLPRGVARGLTDPIARRRPGGPARSAAIVLGLAVTAAGYAVGRATAAA